MVVAMPHWTRGDEAAGHTVVLLHGFISLPCGDDLFVMGFEAAGPTVKPAKGAVCKGIFKGATVCLTS